MYCFIIKQIICCTINLFYPNFSDYFCRREPTLSLNGKTPLSHRETTFLNSLGICSGDLVYVLPFPDFQSENAKPPQEQRSRLQQYNGRPQFSPTSDADPKKKRVHTKPTQPRCRQCSGSGHTQIFLAELREELAAIDRDVGQRKRCLIAASLALQLLSLDYGFRILSETDFQHHLKKNTAKTDGRNTLDRDCTESMDGKEDVDVTDLIYASIQAQQGECVTLFFLWQLEDNPAYVVRVSVALMIDGFAMTVSIYNITSIDRRRPSCFASSTRVLELADLIWPQNPHTFWRVEKFIENFAGQTPFARFALVKYSKLGTMAYPFIQGNEQ